RTTAGPRRAAGFVLTSVGRAAGTVDRALAKPAPTVAGSRSADEEARAYVYSLIEAIGAARPRSGGAILPRAPVATSPRPRNRPPLIDRLAEDAADPRRFRFVDLIDVVELRGETLRLDGWNFGAAGVTIEAAPIARAIIDLIEHAPVADSARRVAAP